jgi:hypothetical protein
MSKRGRPTISQCLEPTISSKSLPVSTFKDAVHLSPNDDYYLVTDSEGNIGNMHFLRPIPEPQVTEPELLQENKNDIVANKSYSYHILIRDAMTIPTFDNCLYSSCIKVHIRVHFDHVPCKIC